MQSSIEIIVVDDGSRQYSISELQRISFPRTSLIRITVNRGVTFAWNLGARHARGEVLIFLNNDVTSDGPWCDPLASSVIIPKNYVAGPELRTERLLPRELGNQFPSGQLLAGWCLAISSVTFKQLGGFDERYRLYFSDTDLQLRAAGSARNVPVINHVANLPLHHIAHQTTHGLKTRNGDWARDRETFLKVWHRETPNENRL